LVRNWGVTHTWTPAMAGDRREAYVAAWRKAVERSFDWV